MNVKVRKIGNSYGIILPKEIIKSLHIVEGDSLHLLEEEDGAKLTPYDPEFENVLKAYDKFSRKYRNALKELAK